MKKAILIIQRDSIELWKGYNDEVSIFLFLCLLDLFFVFIGNKEAAAYAHAGLFVPEILLYIIVIRRSHHLSAFFWFMVWIISYLILSLKI